MNAQCHRPHEAQARVAARNDAAFYQAEFLTHLLAHAPSLTGDGW